MKYLLVVDGKGFIGERNEIRGARLIESNASSFETRSRKSSIDPDMCSFGLTRLN